MWWREKDISTVFLTLLQCVSWYGLSTSEDLKLDKETCWKVADPVHVPPGQLPTTALASFQGSGNTWVRQVLARATGYKTGDIYQSYGDDNYPEFSSSSNDTAIAIKTHTFSTSSSNDYGFKRALLIIRNPLDALYSEFNRMYGGNKTDYADAIHLVNIDGSLSWKWDAWMAHISSWVDFYRYWMKWFPGPTHILYYNNLKFNPRAELLGAINFLGLSPNMTLVNCTLQFPRAAYFKRPAIDPPVPKSKLFGLSMPKARKAIEIVKSIVLEKYGKESPIYKNFNLDVSLKKSEKLT